MQETTNFPIWMNVLETKMFFFYVFTTAFTTVDFLHKRYIFFHLNYVIHKYKVTVKELSSKQLLKICTRFKNVIYLLLYFKVSSVMKQRGMMGWIWKIPPKKELHTYEIQFCRVISKKKLHRSVRTFRLC